jgi:ubiquinone/menaquinone biosynthesis C-methylase UbiE
MGYPANYSPVLTGRPDGTYASVVAFFRKPEQKHSVAVAMTGVNLGDRLLQIGCTDSSLLGAIGAKVGLSGHVSALVPNEEQAMRARRGAEKAGFLLELKIGALNQLPFDQASFNLVVIDNQDGLLSSLRPEGRVALLQQVFRTLAPRGRVVVIERAPRGGLGALLKPASSAPVDPQYQSSGGAVAALQAEGFRAARLLAERDGLSFFEGVR